MLENEFSDKKILVTGAGGFIGSHLAELLVKLGADVTALIHYNSNGTRGWLENSPLLSEINIASGDVRDAFQIRKIVDKKEIVFNLAALIGIPYSYLAPSSYFETNVVGAINLFEAVRDQANCRVIQMSTSEVYGTAKVVPMSESHMLQPQSPYSASKVAADAVALSYHSSFDTQVVLGRPFNTYGPRQSRRAVIPTIICQLLEDNEKVSLGNLDAIRDFTYVEDTCRLLCLLATCERSIGEVINIGTGVGVTVRELFEKISLLMGKSVDINIDQERKRPEKSEVDKLICDNSKLMDLTGSRPSTQLDDGLMRTIEWFTDNLQVNGPGRDYYYV